MEETVEDHTDVWVFSKAKQEWLICKVLEDNVDEGVITIIDETPAISSSSSSSSLRSMPSNHQATADSTRRQPQIVKKSDICVVDPTHLQDLEDLSAMNNLHEAPLINILRKRWLTQRIYTAASDVLISVNPYKSIPGLYDNPSSYFNFPMPGQEFNEDAYLESIADMSPHVFLVANRSLRSLLMPELTPGAPVNQSVIISGESGAGKI
jgi:myosin heavy subunit